MIGGGPSLQYTYLFDKPNKDKVHLATVNGDMIIGGGKPDMIAAYFHLTAGLGVLSAKDGATGIKITFLGARAASGVGLYGHVAKRITLGVLVDFGWMGGLGVDAFATLGFHLGKKPK